MSEENKKCWNCQAENEKENVFCIKCGENLEEPKETEEKKGSNESFGKEEVESSNFTQSTQNRQDTGNQRNNIGAVPVIKEGTRKSSFFNFDKMISPEIIKGLFILSVFISTFAGGMMILYWADTEEETFFFLGVFTIIVSPLVTRVISERSIILFKIHETLEEIRRNSR